MKFYDCKIAPNPRRLRIFLAEKGLEIPTQEVELLKGENLESWYLAKNPQGLVPILELDDGTVLAEVPAICRYLEALHPEPCLLGATPLEAAHVEAAERFAEMQGMQAMGEVFRNQFEGMKDRGMPGMRGIAQIPELVDRGQKRLAAFVEQLDARLGLHEYLAGDKYSLADITAFCVMDFAKMAGNPVHESRDNIGRWYEAVAARPAAAV